MTQGDSSGPLVSCGCLLLLMMILSVLIVLLKMMLMVMVMPMLMMITMSMMTMTLQGDSGGPLVSCGADGDCGTTPGQNYELIGIVTVIVVVAIVFINIFIIIIIIMNYDLINAIIYRCCLLWNRVLLYPHILDITSS